MFEAVQPDVVMGIATSTTARVALVEKLRGFRALNRVEQADQEKPQQFLQKLMKKPWE